MDAYFIVRNQNGTTLITIVKTSNERMVELDRFALSAREEIVRNHDRNQGRGSDVYLIL